MNNKLLLGYDIGSSSIKASLLNAETGELVSSANSPEREMKIESPKIGWAEQHPDTWWQHILTATKKMLDKAALKNYEIEAIGISYQMHGLVLVDKNYQVLRPSIIWCDSRAVEIGNKAFADLGSSYCLNNCLNSPGNFTASKLKWVKENEPDLYSKIYKIMLPGDFIAMKLTDKISTTVSGLSEGIFWDFKNKSIADELVNYYGFSKDLFPEIVPTFALQGALTSKAAGELGLKAGIPVGYRAGDQPNNALSLHVLNPGEIAATAGTSGVIYGVTDKNLHDPDGRVNPFAHVNYSEKQPNVGVLLCINGTGIQYSWLKQNILDNKYSYDELNDMASKVSIGSEGLLCFPYGNGAERSLKNKDVKGHFSGINFNIHGKGHLIRAAQEGIVYSFRYGLDVMKSMGMEFKVVKAGFSNLFQSKVFTEAFVNTCNVDLEIYNTDGSQGAARGAGLGIGYYKSDDEAFKGLKVIEKLTVNPDLVKNYEAAYQVWKNQLEKILE
ncbi:MAG: FGGY family carbohydrate kinase [Ignavibacteriaceae bacterium]